VRLWDAATGTPVGDPLTGHTNRVNAVAAVPLPDAQVLLATGSDDKTVRLWDPATGTPVGEPMSHPSWVNAVAAVPLPDGRVLLATGNHGNEAVRLWDPLTRTRVGEPLSDDSAWVNAMAAVSLPNGRILLATGSTDCTVRLWDPAPSRWRRTWNLMRGRSGTGTSLGKPLTGHSDRVNAVAAVPLPDGRVLLATGGADCTVRLWDPATRAAIDQLAVGDEVTGIAADQGRLFISTSKGLIAIQIHC
jgi:WD40 repeat protein